MEFHYEGHLGGYVIGQPDPACWFPTMWEWLVDQLKIESVIDIGCGEGHSAKEFKRLGCKILGVEGSSRAIQETLIEEVVQHDLRDGAFDGGEFDLAWCCEVVEHIDEEFMPNLMNTLAKAKYVAFTHAIPGQGGHHHVNCRSSLYWIMEFFRNGYRIDNELTETTRKITLCDAPVNHFYKSGMIMRKL